MNVQELLNKCVLCWLATANKKGEPNVSPKELFLATNTDEIIIANIASPRSIRNISENPSVCISAINIWTQKGLQCIGQAKIISPQQIEFKEIEADFKSTHADISGPLTISVPREFGISFLSQVLIGFKNKYPEIQLTADFDDRIIDLDRENYDFAVRVTPKVNEKLLVEKVGVVRHYLCASPNYLKENNAPKTLDDLKGHRLLHFGTAKRGTWRFKHADQKKEEMLEF